MKSPKLVLFSALLLPWLISPAVAGEENPLAKYLAVPGTMVTLPVSDAKQPFPLEFSPDARERFKNFHYQMAGDYARY